jgi:O-antigen/teichoic acid export membrane protein
LGVVIVGFYSNYFLIITTLKTFLNQFSSGILASFGNLIVSESNEKSYSVFKKAYFINYIIFNFASISLLCLFNPFITLWINADSLLDFPVVALLSLNFFITGITEVLGLVRTSAGLFRPDRYLHILLAAVNLIVSIILVQIIGIFGVFLGTFLCLVIKEISVLPSIVYRNIFKMRVREYYKMLLSFCVTTLVSAVITLLLCNYLDRGGVLWFLLQCVVCIIVPNAVAVLVYRKRPEYAYMRDMVVKKLRQLRNKERES